MKILKVFLLLIFTTSILTSEGQYSLIKGTVYDRRTNEKICAANVELLNEKGESINGSSSDINGKFLINKIEKGNYKIIVSYIQLGDSVFNNIQIMGGDTILLDLYLPTPCVEENKTGICPHCSCKNNVITISPLSLVDIFFKNKRLERKYNKRKVKRN